MYRNHCLVNQELIQSYRSITLQTQTQEESQRKRDDICGYQRLEEGKLDEGRQKVQTFWYEVNRKNDNTSYLRFLQLYCRAEIGITIVQKKIFFLEYFRGVEKRRENQT